MCSKCGQMTLRTNDMAAPGLACHSGLQRASRSIESPKKLVTGFLACGVSSLDRVYLDLFDCCSLPQLRCYRNFRALSVADPFVTSALAAWSCRLPTYRQHIRMVERGLRFFFAKSTLTSHGKVGRSGVTVMARLRGCSCRGGSNIFARRGEKGAWS